MQLSAKISNACLAAIELATRHTNPQPVGLKTIAKEQGLSSQFLVQILLQLKRAGLVTSTRGACGGYRLAKEPHDISLLDIVDALDGATVDRAASGASLTPEARIFQATWMGAVEEHRQRLSEITLAALAASVEAERADMYYI